MTTRDVPMWIGLAPGDDVLAEWDDEDGVARIQHRNPPGEIALSPDEIRALARWCDENKLT